MTQNADYVSESARAEVVEFLTGEGIRLPDVAEHNYAKWNTEGGGYVIFRANFRGPFGTLDAGWYEADGRFNGLFCPVSYDFLPWIARDTAALLAVEGIPPRDLLQSLGKRDRQPAQIDGSGAAS